MQNTSISTNVPPLSSEEITSDRVLALVHRAAAKLPLPKADRQDLEQDIFEVLLNRAADGRSAQYGLPSFIFTTAHLLCRGVWRRNRHWTYLQDGDNAPDPVLEPQSSGPDPEQQLAAAEDWARICAAISALSPGQRDVAERQIVHGLSIPEIAAELGIPRGRVRVRLHRAWKRITAMIGDLAPASSCRREIMEQRSKSAAP